MSPHSSPGQAGAPPARNERRAAFFVSVPQPEPRRNRASTRYLFLRQPRRQKADPGRSPFSSQYFTSRNCRSFVSSRLCGGFCLPRLLSQGHESDTKHTFDKPAQSQQEYRSRTDPQEPPLPDLAGSLVRRAAERKNQGKRNH